MRQITYGEGRTIRGERTSTRDELFWFDGGPLAGFDYLSYDCGAVYYTAHPHGHYTRDKDRSKYILRWIES